MGEILLDGENVFAPEWVGKRLFELAKTKDLLSEEYICIDRKSNTLIPPQTRIRTDVSWEIRRVLSKG